MTIEPLAWKDRPSLIERLLPAQKISAEAQKERKAVQSQTLTTLGSYWKGRKPLILVKACILGALLPATDDPEADLAIFEKLMAIDDASFSRRAKSAKDENRLVLLPYLERLALAYRPEELSDDALYRPIWPDVNQYLGTNARNVPELVEQLGILRFGHRPEVGDTFCGGGSVPFESARLGCDVFASDLNPVGCMLTWGALHIIGATKAKKEAIYKAQFEVASAVDIEIKNLAVETDTKGNRAKAFLYCLETRCPQTGWLIPLSSTWIISYSRNVIAYLRPNFENKCFDIEIYKNANSEQIAKATRGTVQDGDMVYELEGETYCTPMKTLRGDYRLPDGATGNKIRRWERSDFVPRLADIFQERLYCIKWITKATVDRARQETFFASVTDEDLEREAKVEAIVAENLAHWQAEGLVPDMPIEPGAKTDEPIRTRGWTHWHHLFGSRSLLSLSTASKKILSYSDGEIRAALCIPFAKSLDWLNKGCYYGTGAARESISHLLYNQAFNTFWNYGVRSAHETLDLFTPNYKHYLLKVNSQIYSDPASQVRRDCQIWITDPPYADAIRYEEITEFFIAWLRKNPPEPFKDWVWDSRRPLAIKGRGEDFRREMIAAYRAMADHMPDNGLQIVMFTHQDTSVWADMASIVWGAGLRVTAAWYIATETTSELKKGGYVQGTVLLVLRKRLADEGVYRDELVQEVRDEVARQIETMVGLNQATEGHGRSENLFEDADLQMAGYAAALRVLTGYSRIDGQDMTAEALRPRAKGERDIVKEIIDYAVQVANEHLVPDGVPPATWERLSGPERFYMKMLDIEAVGLKKLDNYQNFAKAFRVADYGDLMGSIKANDARLKHAAEFKKAGFDGEFGQSPLRALLYALWELQRDLDIDEVMGHLHDQVPGYWTRRDDLMALAQAIAMKRETTAPEEAGAARILFTRIKNERLG